jgi:hypothetical protein
VRNQAIVAIAVIVVLYYHKHLRAGGTSEGSGHHWDVPPHHYFCPYIKENIIETRKENF